MAASSDLQALQLENRNLQQKLDWKQLKINQLETKVRDLRDGGLAANLERLERSLCRLSLQMEHVQLVIKKPGSGRFTALLLRRKYLLWRYALACERLRCEPWRPWGWGGTTRGLRRPARLQSSPEPMCAADP